ncbi:sulfite exporter TauE/SafE family protein [Accumulibacter sp.]|uniref:sulfite exporter TauE/SafE family protein n=1 Tax=Accumulibacter sp. TaxID=2053492 RepID=UPI0025F9D416|nr:sulfite exporter TauE/SafE family protein [Accumulibacter sp.]MCM8610512.1 sulfite exporter TauE/SafE family protein [Accumulibacter sp.]MCM8634412.1 sulfite exporter TauE/SafE family protein [Accumulibacter sp.]MCM8641710.1 sulfite exporter TauE/SafE family protein [Accumulibacter sp.]
MEWMYTLSGFVVGAIVGLTGVGGGSLMTPLLVLLFGVHPATAVGTDLLYAAVTKAGGTVVHARKGHVDWQVTRLLAIGSLPAAALTIWALSYLPRQSAATSQLISVSLGVALLLTAAAIIFRQQLQHQALAHADDAAHTQFRAPVTIACGVLLGVLVTVSSVGAGALGAAILFYLYPRLPAIRIVGSDVAHAVPLTLVAGLGHWLIGSVDWSLLGSLLLGSLPGIWLGSHASARVPDRILRPILAGMLLLIGGKLIAH